ncbi:MAG: hypothetical protein DHS20C09_13940 [marine bacterium B5-7]|nr:MAG: hypothetical protein DHS20C09_13940 [marine bacterium B5-7]
MTIKNNDSASPEKENLHFKFELVSRYIRTRKYNGHGVNNIPVSSLRAPLTNISTEIYGVKMKQKPKNIAVLLSTISFANK